MRNISVTMPEDLVLELKQLAEKSGVSVSAYAAAVLLDAMNSNTQLVEATKTLDLKSGKKKMSVKLTRDKPNAKDKSGPIDSGTN